MRPTADQILELVRAIPDLDSPLLRSQIDSLLSQFPELPSGWIIEPPLRSGRWFATHTERCMSFPASSKEEATALAWRYNR